MRINTILNHEKSGKSQVRSLLFSEAIDRKYSQAKIIERRNQIIASLPEFPRYIRSGIAQYFDGMYEAYQRQHTVFLYLVDGKFYKTNHYKEEDLPSWDTLHREEWGNLSDKGGLFYKFTHEVFFKSEA